MYSKIRYRLNTITNLSKMGENGDTIVEVMFVLAILSFAITIAYSTATRSLADAQQSQESTYAAEIAQSQVEEIRSMISKSTEQSTTGDIIPPTIVPAPTITPISPLVNDTNFCMDTNAGSNNGTDIVSTNSDCQLTPVSGAVTYTLVDTLIQYTPNSTLADPFPYPEINSFRVVVTWPDAKGQGTDEVVLFYRDYPPLPLT